MFWLTLALLSLWFAGGAFLKAHLASAPVAFLLYWSAVTLLAIAIILLAGYDMLRVPRELRQEHRLPKSPR
jgi:hypothetical protein